MTKTLTEQWREGTLPEGYYYTKVINILDKERIMIDYYIQELHHFEIMPSEYVKEVIVEAPTYQDFVQQRDFVKDHQKVLIENMNLKRKLEIATKALKEIAFEIGDLESDYGYHYELAKKALKEMEGVK